MRAWIALGSLAVLFAIGLVGRGQEAQDDPLWETAGDVEAGELRFLVTDANGNEIPARLTFVKDGEAAPELFRATQVAPEQLAVRKNVIYSLRGHGRLTVPVGTYRVYASLGLEWSLAARVVTIREGEPQTFEARLRKQIDTGGWIGGDFHLHTLTYSGHGDSNLSERIISLLGEGVDFAVATDHDHNTDYGPMLKARGGESRMTAVTGNEVSTSIGHFNAFPLDPKRPVIDSGIDDPRELFTVIRREPNRYGERPIVQVNHPRWEGIDYFTKFGLDPVTGEAADDRFSFEFDTVEIFNSNQGYGYDDEERLHDTGNRYWVLADWFRMLNTGYRAWAVGNSDSHTVHATFAGYPRNYVRYDGPSAPSVDVPSVLAGIRAGTMFTTSGPFVELTVNGQPMGSEVRCDSKSAEIAVRVRAASWIDCDRVHLVVNGDIQETWEVPPQRSITRLEKRHTLTLERDAWVAILVEGDDPLEPLLPTQGRASLPRAVTNPVFLDADGDGQWTPLAAIDTSLVAEVQDPSELERLVRAEVGSEQAALLLWKAKEAHPDVAAQAALSLLGKVEGRLLLTAARVLEAHPLPEAEVPLRKALKESRSDPERRVALLRALVAHDPGAMADGVRQFLIDEGVDIVQRYSTELRPGLGGRFIADWMAIGYFPNPDRSTLYSRAFGPETDGDVRHEHEGRGGPARWRRASVSRDGYLDLLDPADRAGGENAIVYAQTWVLSPDERDAMYAIGTDDGCQLFFNGQKVYEDRSRHAASPFRQMGVLKMKAGWNRVLVKVENGSGDCGLYFQLFDPKLHTSAMQ
ncbi:MAG: CehA/McbA family metallohydrolase [Planctomycetota bacterium]